MSAEDDIFDAVTRHQIFVLRYAKGREREAEEFIARQLEEVIYRLETGNLTDFGRSRAQAQATDLYQYLGESDKNTQTRLNLSWSSLGSTRLNSTAQ